ncbi:hypothetical protein EU96_0352 [Prochlorococcus marinus str. MIT 9302]|uniref:Uncharacterized protein n=1 Tax=Prochlorococcus marinus str. MIT 9302 TaxID=74545 RepID=A0A0A2A9Z8_PROMR|nr:hypothetical protein EU96_0352 [Prochlorococcus marinus str. MIT 9302]
MIKISSLSFRNLLNIKNNYNLKKSYQEFYNFFLFPVCFFYIWI